MGLPTVPSSRRDRSGLGPCGVIAESMGHSSLIVGCGPGRYTKADYRGLPFWERQHDHVPDPCYRLDLSGSVET